MVIKFFSEFNVKIVDIVFNVVPTAVCWQLFACSRPWHVTTANWHHTSSSTARLAPLLGHRILQSCSHWRAYTPEGAVQQLLLKLHRASSCVQLSNYMCRYAPQYFQKCTLLHASADTSWYVHIHTIMCADTMSNAALIIPIQWGPY